MHISDLLFRMDSRDRHTCIPHLPPWVKMDTVNDCSLYPFRPIRAGDVGLTGQGIWRQNTNSSIQLI